MELVCWYCVVRICTCLQAYWKPWLLKTKPLTIVTLSQYVSVNPGTKLCTWIKNWPFAISLQWHEQYVLFYRTALKHSFVMLDWYRIVKAGKRTAWLCSLVTKWWFFKRLPFPQYFAKKKLVDLGRVNLHIHIKSESWKHRDPVTNKLGYIFA